MFYTKPARREHIKQIIIQGNKGCRSGQWSVRKAQLLSHEYEKAGGGYRGPKTPGQRKNGEQNREKPVF